MRWTKTVFSAGLSPARSRATSCTGMTRLSPSAISTPGTDPSAHNTHRSRGVPCRGERGAERAAGPHDTCGHRTRASGGHRREWLSSGDKHRTPFRPTGCPSPPAPARRPPAGKARIASLTTAQNRLRLLLNPGRGSQLGGKTGPLLTFAWSGEALLLCLRALTRRQPVRVPVCDMRIL